MKQKLKYGACGSFGVIGEHAPMRRSVTIIEENNKQLQRARGILLQLGNDLLDMDYTSALNLFLRMGLKKFFKESFDEDDLDYIVANSRAKMEIRQDQIEEMKNEMASLAESISLEQSRKEREQREKAEAESVAK
jgi:hypothetical protein